MKRRSVFVGAPSAAAGALACTKPNEAADAGPSIEGRAAGCLSVLDVGARGDGVHDDTEALQAAVDKSSMVFLPAGTYRTSRAIRLRSSRHVFGVGAATIIRNDQKSSKRDERCAFLLGDHHPAAFVREARPEWRYPHFALNSVRETDRAVNLMTHEDTGGLRVGEFVWLRSVNELIYDKSTIPHFLQLTKIEAIDKKSGAIELADPVDFSAERAYLSPLRAYDSYLGHPFFAVENVILQNMHLDAYTWGGMRYCAYKCQIRNLSLQNAQHLVVGNCLARCIIENISGSFVQRFLEIKNGSSWTYFRNIHGRYMNPHGFGVSRPWETGERAFGLTFEDCHLTLDSSYPGGLPAVELKTSATKLVRCTVRDARQGGRHVVINIPHNRGPANRRITLDGVDIFANAPHAYVVVGSAEAGGDYAAPGLVTLQGCGFRDAEGRPQHIVVQGGAQIGLVGNEFGDGGVLLDGGYASVGENFGLRIHTQRSGD